MIRNISASIPAQRKVKDHVEAEINHFLRGKAHTSPDAEEDMKILQTAYRSNEIHKFQQGRKLNANDKVKDYLAIGSERTKLKGVIERWVANRAPRCETTEDWCAYNSDSDSELHV